MKTKAIGAKHEVEENEGSGWTAGHGGKPANIENDQQIRLVRWKKKWLLSITARRCFPRAENTGVSQSFTFGEFLFSGKKQPQDIVMRCEELQIDLASYMDDALSEDNVAILRNHLSACPLCRQALDDMRKVRVGLRSLPRPGVPQAVLTSVRQSVRAKADPASEPFGIFATRLNVAPYRLWVASYAAGACASVIFGMAFLWLILLSNANAGGSSFNTVARSSTSSPIQVVPVLDSTRVILSPKDFANTRSDIAAVSPSVNPQGSLIELTNSLVNSDVKNDEVVVVADVFRNGSAQIAEVVEPSRNQNAVPELARALDYESVNPPFVPATFDQRSDTIRVVLKIQSVDVSTKEPSRKRRSL